MNRACRSTSRNSRRRKRSQVDDLGPSKKRRKVSNQRNPNSREHCLEQYRSLAVCEKKIGNDLVKPIHIPQSGKVDENGVAVYDSRECFGNHETEYEKNENSDDINLRCRRYSKWSRYNFRVPDVMDILLEEAEKDGYSYHYNYNQIKHDKDRDKDNDNDNDEKVEDSKKGKDKLWKDHLNSNMPKPYFIDQENKNRSKSTSISVNTSKSNGVSSDDDDDDEEEENDDYKDNNNQNSNGSGNSKGNSNSNSNSNSSIGTIGKSNNKTNSINLNYCRQRSLIWLDGKTVDRKNEAMNSIIHHDNFKVEMKEWTIGDRIKIWRKISLDGKTGDQVLRNNFSSIGWKNISFDNCNANYFNNDGKYQVFQYHLQNRQLALSRFVNRNTVLNYYGRPVTRMRRFEKWIPLIPDECFGTIIDIKKKVKEQRSKWDEDKEMHQFYTRYRNLDKYVITIRVDDLFILEKEYDNNLNNVTSEKMYNFVVKMDELNNGGVYDWGRCGFGLNSKINDGLYKIRGKQEVDLVAEYLMYLRKDINWLVAFEIASFAMEKWQRDVYFNCYYFENMIKNSCLKSIQLLKLDAAATTGISMTDDEETKPKQKKQEKEKARKQKKQDNQNPKAKQQGKWKNQNKNKGKEKTNDSENEEKQEEKNGDMGLKSWNRDDILCVIDDPMEKVCEIYCKEIWRLARQNQPTFPHARSSNQLYSKQASIQSIHNNALFDMSSDDIRDYLSIVKKRLSIGKNSKTKLFSYQLRTLCWMYLVERKVVSKQRFSIGGNDMRFTNDKSVKCRVWYDYINNRFLPVVGNNLKKDNYNSNNNNNNNNSKEKEKEKENCNSNDNSVTTTNTNRSNNCNRASTSKETADDSELKEIEWLGKRLLSFNGGIISDDVGLGKTLTMLSLILCHPGNGDITNRINLNKTECGPRADSEQLKCNATLVIAPSHLVNQWESEIIKHFQPYCLNCIKISTKSEHSKISYQDILQCQIVIVSAQFLGNSWNYRDLSNEWNMHINPALPTCETLKSMNDIGNIANGGLRRSRRVLGKENNIKLLGMQDLTRNSPLLGLFYWRRIILDEAPDYMQIGSIRKSVLQLEGKFKWYVSATPFPRRECVSYCAQFLDININDEYVEWDKLIDTPMGYNLHCMLYYYLFYKNTIASIGNDNYLPEIDDCCKYFHFHPIEKLLYDLVKNKRGTEDEDLKLERRICSGLFTFYERNYFNDRGLSQQIRDEIRQKFEGRGGGDPNNNDNDDNDNSNGDSNQNRESDNSNDNSNNNSNSNSKSNCKNNSSYLWKLVEINRIWYRHKICDIRNNISMRTRTLVEYQDLQRKLKSKKKLFKRRKKKFSIKKAFGEHNVSLYQDLSSKIQNVENRLDDLYQRLDEYEKEYKCFANSRLEKKVEKWENEFKLEHGNIVGDALLPIVNKYGSKQGHLITYVKELLYNKSNKLIIFSLFGNTLKTIQSRLESVGIKASLLVGNVYARRRAVAAFQTSSSTSSTTTTAASRSKNKNKNNYNSRNRKKNRNKSKCKNKDASVTNDNNGGSKDKDKDSTSDGDSSTRVILLSIEHGASGANFTEATHVILCDPVPGSSSEAYSAERQAIGRAVRQGMSLNDNDADNKKITKVVRLIVKNTIEHETHKRNSKIRMEKCNETKQLVQEMNMQFDEEMGDVSLFSDSDVGESDQDHANHRKSDDK